MSEQKKVSPMGEYVLPASLRKSEPKATLSYSLEIDSGATLEEKVAAYKKIPLLELMIKQKQYDGSYISAKKQRKIAVLQDELDEQYRICTMTDAIAFEKAEKIVEKVNHQWFLRWILFMPLFILLVSATWTFGEMRSNLQESSAVLGINSSFPMTISRWAPYIYALSFFVVTALPGITAINLLSDFQHRRRLKRIFATVNEKTFDFLFTLYVNGEYQKALAQSPNLTLRQQRMIFFHYNISSARALAGNPCLEPSVRDLLLEKWNEEVASFIILNKSTPIDVLTAFARDGKGGLRWLAQQEIIRQNKLVQQIRH